MRFVTIFQVVALLLVTGIAPAQAQNLGKYIWGPPNTDPVRPYLEEGKIPHNSQWADDKWTPQDWIDSRGGSAKAVIDGFYSSGIVTDQYSDDDIPVLEVGQRFLELSDQDKRRVAMFIDDTFGITKAHGLFLIYFHKHETPVGLFTSEGLQLQ
jgi:hypothetical protein